MGDRQGPPSPRFDTVRLPFPPALLKRAAHAAMALFGEMLGYRPVAVACNPGACDGGAVVLPHALRHDRTQSEETHALLAAAFNPGDLDAFVEVYEGDATLIVPPERTLANGREEIRTAQATFALQPRAQIDVVEKLQSDGLALTHARWSIVGTDGEGQSPPAEWRRDDRLAAAAGGRLSGFLSETRG